MSLDLFSNEITSSEAFPDNVKKVLPNVQSFCEDELEGMLVNAVFLGKDAHVSIRKSNQVLDFSYTTPILHLQMKTVVLKTSFLALK